jgi:hypothetical protein
VEYLSLLPSSTRQRIEAETRYIHVLKSKQHLGEDGHIDDGGESEWEGSTNSTRKTVEASRLQLSGELAGVNSNFDDVNIKIDGVNSKIEVSQKNVDSKLDEVDMRFQVLETKLDKVLSLLIAAAVGKEDSKEDSKEDIAITLPPTEERRVRLTRRVKKRNRIVKEDGDDVSPPIEPG